MLIALASLGPLVAPAALAATTPAARRPSPDSDTRTPIKHLVIIIGENRSFDHVFATYEPKPGEKVWNLLSEGIVRADGSPGPSFGIAEQRQASDPASDPFLLNPPKAPFPNRIMPAPLAGGPKVSYVPRDSLDIAKQSESGLPEDYYRYLVTGGTGLAAQTPDERIKNVHALPPGPFQLTNGSALDYHAYSASPVHRFYQMWQQLDCDPAQATVLRPSGCDSRLFSWVEVTVGPGSDGKPPPASFKTDYAPGSRTTGEGSTALGFYNMQTGDAPYLKGLADGYAMSDNFHQSVSGGTGVNHIMLGHGDVLWFSDGSGHPAVPPRSDRKDSAAGIDTIENPNPAPGTNNWYRQDGYGAFSAKTPAPAYGGGSYSDCSDPRQPGVAAVLKYLASLPRPIASHCEPGHYYLLNNNNPGYFGNGRNASTDKNPRNSPFTLPPSSVRGIGDALLAKRISWKYYGDHWNAYLNDPYQLNYGAIGPDSDEYCPICNPFQYDTSIMGNAAVRLTHLKDTLDLYADIAAGTLPAISFVKPSGLVDGHPDSSKLDLFEGFSKKIIDAVKANPELWKDTAILVTFDEGGGYYDSGYVQPLDFFGDGTRIPMIAVSRFTKPGHIAHDYSDHVSILKFIERNWGLQPLTARSRDNFPNPVPDPRNAYAPTNTPAISDLFELFDFSAK
ncbi:MAG TPA: alkaline phosphatase family protein [Steroidobacteraceae bacterium]|nr:alkaline phosphatase family protein [Steroidobacteraceae bacterium]